MVAINFFIKVYMKNMLYAFLILSSFQIFGMYDEEMRFGGKKIISLTFNQTKDFSSYNALLEDNSVICATLFLTGPAKYSVFCTRDTQVKINKFFVNSDPETLPASTFGILKNLYKESQEK